MPASPLLFGTTVARAGVPCGATAWTKQDEKHWIYAKATVAVAQLYSLNATAESGIFPFRFRSGAWERDGQSVFGLGWWGHKR